MIKINPFIRLLEGRDIPEIAQAFETLGWNKPASQYERYLAEQTFDVRDVYVAFIENQFAGISQFIGGLLIRHFKRPKFQKSWISMCCQNFVVRALARR